jgi:hypothetical protein
MVPRFLASISPARLRLVLHLLGAVILLAGYSGAALVWRAQDRIDQQNAYLEANGVDINSPLDSRRDTQQLQLQYGAMGLVTEGVREFVARWTHGRPLAKAMIVLSSASAIGCFLVAGRRAL